MASKKGKVTIKSKIQYPSGEIYRSECSCGGEKIESRRHLPRNVSYLFAWETLMAALKDEQTRKNLEVLFIAVIKPSFNE